MAFFDNDRWRGVFVPELNAPYLYTIIAWRDRFESWRDEVSKKHAAGVDIARRADRRARTWSTRRSASERASAADKTALKALVAKVDATDDRVGAVRRADRRRTRRR